MSVDPSARIPGCHDFWWGEFAVTNHGHEAEQLAALEKYHTNIMYLAQRVLQPIRSAIGREVKITSGVRSPEVNAAISGASRTSQHMKGEAADFVVPGYTAKELFALWKIIGWNKFRVWGDNPPVIGQVIFEDARPGREGGEWIHISLGGPPWRSSASSNEVMTWDPTNKYVRHDIPPDAAFESYFTGLR